MPILRTWEDLQEELSRFPQPRLTDWQRRVLERMDDHGLTEREREVGFKLYEDKTSGEIAYELGISPQTIKNHLSHIFKKTDTTGRIGFIVKMLDLEDS